MKYKVGDVIKTVKKNNKLIKNQQVGYIYPKFSKGGYMFEVIVEITEVYNKFYYVRPSEENHVVYLREEWVDRKIEKISIFLKTMKNEI